MKRISTDPFEIEDYPSPYPPAERLFVDGESVPPEFRERAFMAVTPAEGYGYWLRGPQGGGHGYSVSGRDGGAVFPWSEARTWSSHSTRVEMLPLPIQPPTEPNEADRDIKWGELGKVGDRRLCLIKDKDGKYLDGNLKEVPERKLATIHKCSKLFGLDIMKPYTFEMLKPFDMDMGGPDMQEVVCYAEAQRQMDKVKFLVKSAKPNETNGYPYYSHDRNYPYVSRKLAHIMDRKELRRRFDEVPKAEIIIEMLKPMRISAMEDFFNESAKQLIQASPKNDHVRGFMLSKLKQMPPAELDTYDKIKEWVEWNVDKAVLGQKAKPLTAYATAETPPPTVEDIALTVTIKRKRTRHGTCACSVRQSGQQPAQITMAELREQVENSGSWSSFRERIKALAAESDDNVRYSDEVDVSHQSHVWSDTSGEETFWGSITTADEAIKAFCRQHMPDVLERFGLR